MPTVERSIGPRDELAVILGALDALKRGDPAVRLPHEWTGLPGKVADTFNDVVEMNERLAEELARLSRVVGKDGKIDERATLGEVTGSWRDSIAAVNRLIANWCTRPARRRASSARWRKGDLSQTMALEIDGRPLEGEFLRTAKTVNRMVDQLGAFAVGGDARGARSRHRRQARRPGRGQGRRRHVEGPHRQRQLDGRQPHRPGAQHRRRHDRRRERRPVEEDHRRREGRDPRAQEHHQHDGRPAPLLRVRSDARRARGRHRGQARRPGRRPRRRRARGRT